MTITQLARVMLAPGIGNTWLRLQKEEEILFEALKFKVHTNA